MKKLLLTLILLLPSLAFGQSINNRYLNYSPLYFTPTTQEIDSSTVDAADNATFCLSSGGACLNSRGGFVALAGNENASHGRVAITAGNDAGSGDIVFNTGNVNHLFIPDSITDQFSIAFGTTSATSPQLIIRSNKADAADDGTLQLTAGGAVDTTRGAYLQLLGDDYGGAGAGGGITYEAGTGTAATHKFNTAGSLKWSINAAGLLLSNVTNGGSLQFAKPSSEIYFGTGVNQLETYNIRGNSTDAADKTLLCLSGGGACGDVNRGAYLKLYGNEYTSNVGIAYLASGYLAGSYVEVQSGETYMLWMYAAATSAEALTFGGSWQATPTFTMRGALADGADALTLNITAGGAVGTTRGAGITLLGDDVGGAGAGGGITFEAGTGTLATINFLAAGIQKWQMPTGSSTVIDLVAGVSGTANEVATIRFPYADASDTGTLNITAGGAVGTTRGAGIALLGDDVGGAGAGGGITYEAGTGTAGTHKFNTAGTLKWSISAAGVLASDATNGGNLVFNKVGTSTVDTLTTKASAGSTQADAVALTATYFTLVSGANGTTGAKFPAFSSYTVGQTVKVHNNAASALKLYSNAAGDFINDVAGTTAYSVAANTSAICFLYDATHIYCK